MIPVLLALALAALLLILLLQAWAAAAQATAILSAQLLACMLGAMIPLAFLAGFRLAGGEIRMPAFPRERARGPLSLPDRKTAPIRSGRVPEEAMEIIREWWS